MTHSKKTMNIYKYKRDIRTEGFEHDQDILPSKTKNGRGSYPFFSKVKIDFYIDSNSGKHHRNNTKSLVFCKFVSNSVTC